MTVTIDIPNTIYLKIEKIASAKAEPTANVIENFFNEKIVNTLDAWWNENKIYTSEDSLYNGKKQTKLSQSNRFDIW